MFNNIIKKRFWGYSFCVIPRLYKIVFDSTFYKVYVVLDNKMLCMRLEQVCETCVVEAGFYVSDVF